MDSIAKEVLPHEFYGKLCLLSTTAVVSRPTYTNQVVPNPMSKPQPMQCTGPSGKACLGRHSSSIHALTYYEYTMHIYIIYIYIIWIYMIHCFKGIPEDWFQFSRNACAAKWCERPGQLIWSISDGVEWHLQKPWLTAAPLRCSMIIKTRQVQRQSLREAVFRSMKTIVPGKRRSDVELQKQVDHRVILIRSNIDSVWLRHVYPRMGFRQPTCFIVILSVQV